LKCNKVEYCLTFPFKKLVFDVQIYFDCIIDDFLQNSFLSRDGDHVTCPLWDSHSTDEDYDTVKIFEEKKTRFL